MIQEGLPSFAFAGLSRMTGYDERYCNIKSTKRVPHENVTLVGRVTFASIIGATYSTCDT